MATVACKLPNGISITHADQTMTLVGASDSSAVAGFGLTRDVDADWFKDWASKHKDFPPLKTGAIFISDDNKAADEAAERADDADVQTGLEPLDPEKPAPGIEPTDETKKELAKNADKREEAKQRAARA